MLSDKKKLTIIRVQTFLIKKYPGGVMTEHILGLKVGDELSVKGPIPKFPYKANEFEVHQLLKFSFCHTLDAQSSYPFRPSP